MSSETTATECYKALITTIVARCQMERLAGSIWVLGQARLFEPAVHEVLKQIWNIFRSLILSAAAG